MVFLPFAAERAFVFRYIITITLLIDEFFIKGFSPSIVYSLRKEVRGIGRMNFSLSFPSDKKSAHREICSPSLRHKIQQAQGFLSKGGVRI